MAVVNWGELGKQIFDWGGDYDVFSDVSAKGGVRNPVNNVSSITGMGSQGTAKNVAVQTPQKPTQQTQLQNDDVTPIVERTGPANATSAQAAADAAKRAANQAARDNTQRAIDSLDTELNTGYKNIDDSFNSVTGQYDREAQKVTADHEEQTVTNNNNLSQDRQNALLAAAQGRRGLRGTMSAMGALSGDGIKLADRVVTEGAKDDIGAATDTAATNSMSLDKAKRNFEEEDKQRRAEAETARNNSRTATEGAVMSKRQQMLQKMAELFSEAEDAGGATRYLNEAGALNEGIAQRTAVAATPIVAKSAAFTPGKLGEYLAGAGDMTVEVGAGAPGGGNPSTILAGRNGARRREDELVAA
jgi:hypothetical protein